MEYKKKYLKYKQKYLQLKQKGGLIDCSREAAFMNNFGTCWNIAIFMILIFGDKSKNEFQQNMTIKTTILLREALPKLKIFLPYHCINIDGSLKKESIFSLLSMIRILKTKMNLLEKRIKQGNFENYLDERYCEEEFTQAFFKLFYKTKFKNNLGGSSSDPFFLINLLSIIFLKKFMNLTEIFPKSAEFNITQITDTYGLLVSIPGHVISLYICNNEQKLCDDDLILDFNWSNKFQEWNNLIDKYISYSKKFGTINISNKEYYILSGYKKVNLIEIITEYDDESENFVKNNLYQYLFIYSNIGIIDNLDKLFSDYPDYRDFIDINIKDINDWTALMYAVDNNNTEITSLLLKVVGINVNLQYDNGSTVLMYAVNNNNTEIVSLLLEREANVNTKNVSDWTALMYAVYNNNTEIVSLLLKVVGINVNIRNENGWTALMHAVNKNNTQITSLLLNHGVDVNIQNKNGWTALMLAVNNNNTEIVSLLLDHGVDVNIQGKNNWTALMLAVNNNNTEIVSLLLKVVGIDVNIKDDYRRTALMRARNNGYTEIVDLINKFTSS